MSDDLKLFGHKARLIIELEDGEHDISWLLEPIPHPTMGTGPWDSGWRLDPRHLMNEISIERRARKRAQEKAGHDGP